MKHISTIKTNFIYNLFYQLLTLVTPLITTPYLTRVLGVERIGTYAFSYSVAYYFILIAMLGLNNYGQREIARVQEDIAARSRTFWSIYFMQLMTACVASLCYIGYCLLFGNTYISWIMLLYVFSAMLDISWFFFGIEAFRITVLRNSVIRVLSIAAILLFVKNSDSLFFYAWIMAGSQLLSQLILWTNLKEKITWYKPEPRLVFSHFRPNITLFLPVIAVSLYKVMDKVMLGVMTTYEEVGFYESSEKVIQLPTSFTTSLGAVMLPRMSNLAAKREARAERPMILNSMIFGVSLVACTSFGLMAVANVFVPFFYGNGYGKCVTLFYILLPSCIFLAIGNVLRTQYLIPHSMDKEYTISLLLGAVVNLCVNGLLIPHMASVGASIGTLLAEGTVAIVQLYFLRSVLPIDQYIKETVYIVVCASVMLVLVYIIPSFNSPVLTLALKVPAGACVFIPPMLLRYKALIINNLSKERQ